MEEKVIKRICSFYDWCRKGGLCKNRSDFERMCGLSHNYIYNTMYNTKTTVGVDIIAKIHKTFPMMNVTWMVTGKGSMLTDMPDVGYREGYQQLRKEVDKLKKIIEKL